MTWYYWHSHFEVTWEIYWRPFPTKAEILPPVYLCTTISTCNICICRRFSNVYPYFKLDYYYYYSTKKILFYENLHSLLLLSSKRLSPLEYHTIPVLNFSSHQSPLPTFFYCRLTKTSVHKAHLFPAQISSPFSKRKVSKCIDTYCYSLSIYIVMSLYRYACMRS